MPIFLHKIYQLTSCDIQTKLKPFSKINLFSSKGFSGKQCECGGDSSSSQKVNQECEAKSNNCNGNGKCKCGKCECTEGYVGEFCTCESDECPVSEKDGKICSDHGKCDKCSANKVPGCTCSAGWTREDCSCTESEENCKDDLYDKSKVCSGNGKCECGKCECNSEEFSGKFCQKKTDAICEAMGPCIMGKIEGSKDVDKTCSESSKKNRFGKAIHKLCLKKKSKESKEENYYIYVIDKDECSNYGDVTVGSKDCFAMAEGVGGGEFGK